MGLLNIQAGLKEHEKLVWNNIAMIVMNLVTPKAGAKHERLFNKPASVCWIISSCPTQALGVTKFTNVGDMILITLCCAT